MRNCDKLTEIMEINNELELRRLRKKLKYDDRFFKPIQYWSAGAVTFLACLWIIGAMIAGLLTGLYIL